MSGNDAISLGDHECIGEREMAIKVRENTTEYSPKSFWVPKSVIHDDSEVYKDKQRGDLMVYEWWAEAEGFL